MILCKVGNNNNDNSDDNNNNNSDNILAVISVLFVVNSSFQKCKLSYSFLCCGA